MGSLSHARCGQIGWRRTAMLIRVCLCVWVVTVCKSIWIKISNYNRNKSLSCCSFVFRLLRFTFTLTHSMAWHFFLCNRVTHSHDHFSMQTNSMKPPELCAISLELPLPRPVWMWWVLYVLKSTKRIISNQPGRWEIIESCIYLIVPRRSQTLIRFHLRTHTHTNTQMSGISYTIPAPY